MPTGWDPACFWTKVEKTDTCWLWTGAVDRKGYGRINIRQLSATSPQLAHRISWLLATGEHPGDSFVLHRCDNPPCVRPDHLFLGTAAENSADMVTKGRARKGAQPWESRTHGERNGRAKMTADKVIEIRRRAAAGEYFRDLAPEFGISPITANGIILGNSWRHVWPYSRETPPTREITSRAKRGH